MARNLVYRPATWLRGEPVFRLLRAYQDSQWWSPEQVAAAQEEKLAALLRLAVGQCRFYRERVAEIGLDPGRVQVADLPRLPALTKLDLVERGRDLQLPRLPGTYSWKTTGGSTGIPVRLRKNRFATAAEQAGSWRSYAWYGIRPGDRQARFWGTPITGRARLRYRAIDAVLNRDRFSAFAFSRSDLSRYYERLRTTRPVWAYGYVSMLVQFASFCMEEGLPLADLGIRAVVTTSEVLGPGDRSLLEGAFAARVFDEYGCGEVGAILYECERSSLHLVAENLWVELVPDPTPDRPEACRLLVTDLHNRATPLLRYDVGDRVVPAPACACGRGLPAFREVFGRAYDFIQAPDGLRYHGEFFLYHLERARDQGMPIRQAQFVEDEPGRIRIRIVPGPGYTDTDGRALADSLAETSEHRFVVVAERAEELAREASGKLRLIRSRASAS